MTGGAFPKIGGSTFDDRNHDTIKDIVLPFINTERKSINKIREQN